MLAHQNYCIAVSRRMIIRGQFQATLQQMAGIFQLPEFDAYIGQHPNGSHVSRVLFQQIANNGFRLAHFVITQQSAGLDQFRMRGGEFKMPLKSLAAAVFVTGDRQLMAEALPGRRMLRVNRDRFSQGRDGIITPPDATLALCDFMQKIGRIGVPVKQWRQYIQPFLRHFLQAKSSSKYPFGRNGIGIHFQNLLRLLVGQLRIVSEQISRILEGDLRVSSVGFIGLWHRLHYP